MPMPMFTPKCHAAPASPGSHPGHVVQTRKMRLWQGIVGHPLRGFWTVRINYRAVHA